MATTVIANRYALRHEVGRGSMGSVWLAEDRTLQRRVAVKLMSDRSRDSDALLVRFETEAKALARLRSKHIVQVYDAGRHEGTPYIVMELLEGQDLEARLDGDAMSLSDARRLVVQVCTALTEAAGVGIVHRDVKPQNIFLAPGAEGFDAKLLDFGVASIRSPDLNSSSGTRRVIAGTPEYMAPEQLRGGGPDHLTDLWATAVIAYRAVAGTLPFHSATTGGLVVSICSERVVPPSGLVPSLPVEVDAFFERALSKQPSQRFQSGAEFSRAFAAAVDGSLSTGLLVIDDEEDMAELIRLKFRKQIRSGRYRFWFASNGEEALQTLRDNPDIDIALSDINMPVMDGLTLLGHMPEVAPDTAMVMVTAYGDMGNIRRAMNAGAFDFLVKPINFQDLDATIHKAAAATAGRRQMRGAQVENRVLRRFMTREVVDRLASTGAESALATEALDGTVVAIRVVLDEETRAQPASNLVRHVNANFEVVVPEIRAAGGSIASFEGPRVLAVFTGEKHAIRAVTACASLMAQLRSLHAVAGAGSPYATGVCCGLASGKFTRATVGSQICERLSTTLVGDPVDAARELRRGGRSADVLVHASTASLTGPLLFDRVARDHVQGAVRRLSPGTVQLPIDTHWASLGLENNPLLDDVNTFGWDD